MHPHTSHLLNRTLAPVCSGSAPRQAVHTKPASVEAKPMANGKLSSMQGVFPEALQSLREADPEVHGIIQDEKKRQWCGS